MIILISLWNYCFGVFCAYRNDYLFLRGIFGDYVEFQFAFQSFVVSNAMNLSNIVGRQFRKDVFNFDDFFNVAFRGLYIWMIVWIRSLSIWMAVQIQWLNFFEILKFGQYTFSGPGRDEKGMSAYLSFVNSGIDVDFISFLLNWEGTYFLNDISLSLTVSLFQPDLYITVENFQNANLNSPIWKMSLAILLSNRHFL